MMKESEIMKDVFTRSYESLNDATAKTFRALSVFPNSFTAEAEEAICADPNNRYLIELVRRGLVSFDPHRNRYLLHDEVRNFIAQLTKYEAEMAEVSRLHAMYYKDVFHKANKLYNSGGDDAVRGIWLFGQEWGNFDKGFTWAESHIDDPDPNIAGLCSAYMSDGVDLMRLYLQSKNDRPWLEKSIISAQRVGDEHAEAKHVYDLGVSYQFQEELDKALDYLGRAAQKFQGLGNTSGEGAAYGHIGYVYMARNEVEEAVKYFKLRKEMAESIGDRRGLSIALHNLGDVYCSKMEGDAKRREGIELLNEALRLAHSLGFTLHEGRILNSLGLAYAQNGDQERGLKLIDEGLKLAQKVGDVIGEADVYRNIAKILGTKDREQALEYANKAKNIYEEHSPGNYKEIVSLFPTLAA